MPHLEDSKRSDSKSSNANANSKGASMPEKSLSKVKSQRTKPSASRFLMAHERQTVPTEDWLIGAMSPRYFADGKLLPKLHSGMSRPKLHESKDVVAAAARLSAALLTAR